MYDDKSAQPFYAVAIVIFQNVSMIASLQIKICKGKDLIIARH